MTFWQQFRYWMLDELISVGCGLVFCALVLALIYTWDVIRRRRNG